MAQTGYTPLLIYGSSTTSNAPAAGNLTNSTLGSELAINITDGKLFYKDNANAVQVIAWKTTPTTAGGTGLTSYTAGDMLYYVSGTTLTKLAIGVSGRWLGSSGTAPQWNAPAALTKTDDTNVTLTLGGSSSTALLNAASLTLGWTGQLAVTRGGTGLSTVAQGDILYGSASNTLAALAKNTTATRYLSNTGTNNNPAWAQVDLSNGVTGTLPVVNGGTGLTSFTANGIVYASSTSALTTGSAITFDGTNFATTGTATATKLIPTGNVTAGNGMYLPTTNTLAWSTNGAEGMRLDANRNLAIGTTTGSIFGTSGINLSVSNSSGIATVSIAGSSGNSGYLQLGQGSVRGALIEGSTDTLVFYTNSTGSGTSVTEGMRLNFAGNLGLGVVPSTWSLGKAIEVGNAGNGIWGISSGDVVFSQGAYYNGGWKYANSINGVSFYEQYIGSHKWLTAPSGTAGNSVTFTQVLAVEGGKSLALEGATSQTGTGITFPATQSACSDANTLDDYEEGTFTPTVVGSTAAGTGTYNVQVGRYVKIGKVVTVSADIGWTAHTGTGNLRMGNLPFAVQNVTSGHGGVSVGYLDNIALTANNVAIAYTIANSTYCLLMQYPIGGGAITNVPIDTAGEIIYSATYITD